MSLLDNLTAEMKTAMKAGEKRRLNALRLLVSAVRYVAIDRPGMGDEGVREVLQREAKKRREAVEAYRAGGREEQAKEEEYELGIIEEYLPKMMGEEEIRKVVQNLELKTQNFGEAMGVVMKELRGKAEGGVVSRIVKEQYENKS